MRLARQAAAGLSASGRSQRRAAARTSSLVIPARASGAQAPALGGGPDAGPEAGAEVVGVGAGDHVGDAQPGGQRREDVDQLGLAERAAVAGVGAVALAGELVGARLLVPDPQRRDERRGGGALGRGQARGDGGGGDHPAGAERADGGGQDHAGVHSPGERDEDAGQRRQFRVQGGEPVVERRHVPQAVTVRTAGTRR